MTKNILITGSNGFIGKYLTDYLSNNGYTIYSYDLKKSLLTDKIINVDLNFFNLKHNDIYAIIHLAYVGYPSDNILMILSDIDENVKNTINLLNFSVKNNVSKFIFMSSGGAVYGNNVDMPLNEKSITNPICSYGITKLSIEKYLRLYNNFFNIKTCAIRLSNPYSNFFDKDRKLGIIPMFCNLIKNNKEIQVFGNGDNLRDFIHISDVLSAVKKIIECNDLLDELNIGSGIGTTINQIIKYIEDILCLKAHVKYIDNRKCDVTNNVLDISKAKLLLNWKPLVEINDGIKQILDRM